MITLIEYLLVALTDAQFDKILVMISDGFNAISAGVQVVWSIASPLLIGLVALQLARYQSAAEKARKTIVEKIDTSSSTAQADRTKIINDVADNTQVSVSAFDAANNTNAKIAALAEEIAELKRKQIPPIPRQ